MGMDPMGGAMGGESVNPIMQLYMKLPVWGQTAVKTLLVIAAAALVGHILGKLYASVRYPDPDKNTAISPRLRILFLVILLICGVWLYRTMSMQDEVAEPVSGGEFSSMPEDEYMPQGGGGGTYSMVGGGMAIAVG